MISFIKGILDTVNANSVIIDCNGIGYEAFIGLNTISKLPPVGNALKIHTYMQTRDDGISLYGFISKEELNMFHMLISVSGVGPKSALNVLSVASPQELMLAIIAGDVKVMSSFPGIGPKTAGRLILELKDKIKTESATSYDFASGQAIHSGETGGARNEAITALCALGYSRSEAVGSVASIYEDGTDTQQIIKLALKSLSR